ncbi:MAG: J domain-containing protein [Gammaproteobacteria bacterium]|nr:J domain-containing protein [Gammaproteobacteria bacterium]
MFRFAEHYALLGLKPGASWVEVRTAYRKKVRAWHPDRFQREPRAHKRAEEQTKTINQAYEAIATYYRENGVLPLDPSVMTLPIDKTNNEIVADHPFIEPTPRPKKSKSGFAYDIARWSLFASLPIAYLIFQATIPDESEAAPQTYSSVSAPTTVADIPRPSFTVGSTVGEVYSAQGVPTHTDNDTWHYGTSKVYFSQGKVVRWESATDHPLNTHLADDSTSSSDFSQSKNDPVTDWYESTIDPTNTKHQTPTVNAHPYQVESPAPSGTK